MDEDVSLRGRAKARRRATIQRSAMRLFASRGYDCTTIADVAADAEVAPRTVTLYFPGKLDLALSTISDISHRMSQAFRDNPDLPFTDVIAIWVAAEEETVEPALLGLTTAMFSTNPALQPAASARLTEVAGLTGPAMLREMRLESDSPMAAVAAAAVNAALSTYLTVGMDPGAPGATHETFMRFFRGVIAAAQPR